MALKGDTSNLPLADIFQTLSQNQQTGILTLKLGEEESRKILFAPAGITLLDARAFRASRFAHLLSVGGLAPRDRLDAAIQQIERLASDPLSSVTMLNDLVERRVVDRDAAMKVLVSEVREEIFEIFAQPQLEFEFDESDVPIEEIPKQCLFRTEEVVFEAARRIDEWQIIRSAISDLDEFYVGQPNARLRQEDEPILKSLDGSRTITDVAESLMRPRFEVARCA
jgi:hypothetical protein